MSLFPKKINGASCPVARARGAPGAFCPACSGVARGGGQGGGASAPGRRPEGGAKILPRFFKNLYRDNFF